MIADKRLRALGFRGDQTDAVRVFQATYRRGRYRENPLKVDGHLGPATSEALSRCIKNDGRVSRHFRYIEFQCKCGGRYADCRGVVLTSEVVRLAAWLRREWYPNGLTIVSAYRCPGHNAAVGGTKASRHLVGDAIDLPARIAYARRDELPEIAKGIGYSRSTGLIQHLDTRDTPAVWTYE